MKSLAVNREVSNPDPVRSFAASGGKFDHKGFNVPRELYALIHEYERPMNLPHTTAKIISILSAHRGESDMPKVPNHDPHEPLNLSLNAVQQSMTNHLIFSVGKDTITATDRDWFFTLAHVVRERLTERWMATMRRYYNNDAKRVYYLSMEFLIGRSLINGVLNIGFAEEVRQACVDAGIDLEKVKEMEFDAALGNGGVGRVAACFLRSLGTPGLAGYCMGIRYEYGMFNQRI